MIKKGLPMYHERPPETWDYVEVPEWMMIGIYEYMKKQPYVQVNVLMPHLEKIVKQIKIE